MDGTALVLLAGINFDLTLDVHAGANVALAVGPALLMWGWRLLSRHPEVGRSPATPPKSRPPGRKPRRRRKRE